MEPSSRVTIRDVAARAGVSVATVSKVINGRYGVAASTSAPIQAVPEDQSHEASLAAQGLRRRRASATGILAAGPEPFTTRATSPLVRQPASTPCTHSPARTDPT